MWENPDDTGKLGLVAVLGSLTGALCLASDDPEFRGLGLVCLFFVVLALVALVQDTEVIR